jgi:hypothetical protein
MRHDETGEIMSFRRRIDLNELEDHPSCPKFIRDFLTDMLSIGLDVANLYKPVFPLLGDLVDRTGSRQIIDLCSGAGGPWKNLSSYLESRNLAVKVIFTDLYPNASLEQKASGLGKNFSVCTQSVNATNPPSKLKGMRIMFTAFHHFSEEDAKRILADAVQRNEPIAILDVPQRSITGILTTTLAALTIFVLTPFIRPFSFKRILFTYFVPIIPFAVLFDGIVSCLKAYTCDEMKALAEDAGSKNYEWVAGESRGRLNPLPITWLVGFPRKKK